MDEYVEKVQGDRVENRRPSDVFLALARYRILGERSELGEFGELVETWAQIRSMERRIEDMKASQKSASEWAARRFCVSESDTGGPSSAAGAAPSPRGEGEGGPSSAAAAAPSPRGEGEGGGLTVAEAEARLIDSVDPTPERAPYTGYLSSMKNATRARLLDMRAAGLTSAMLLETAGARIRSADLLDILEAKPVHFSVYEQLAAVLDEIEAQTAPHPSAAPTPSPQGEGRGGADG